jgi:hypothetical protein
MSRERQNAAILEPLQQVAHERAARAHDSALAERVTALKAYQQARFRRSYADLLSDRRYAAAALFFLDELYGPHDFGPRDAQFARIVPALTRLFPHDIVETVTLLARLHALSERLDSAMARHLPSAQIAAPAYAAAWQAVGEPAQREEQVAMTLRIGQALERFTRIPMLQVTLRMMRGPAHAAGLHDLQHFLETGFTTFKEMRGANTFLDTIGQRERALIHALFDPLAAQALASPPVAGPLSQLP